MNTRSEEERLGVTGQRAQISEKESQQEIGVTLGSQDLKALGGSENCTSNCVIVTQPVV